MKKEIILAGRKIEYSVNQNRRTKNLRLTISGNGILTAGKPWYLSDRAVEKFIAAKAQWIIEKLEYCQKISNKNPFRSSQNEYLSYKQSAARLVLKKINHFNKIYRFKLSKISIRNQRTRWGSCSGRGNLNFNYKIIFLPEKMIDYIIVHELCHLKELNHSDRFWKLVSQNVPHYRIIRKDLQKKGIELR
ncbi:hypothetical protein COX21_02005 [Candidatus Falkowbacteria bacterium CG23_combo_of_CG06-09_8_20_14_all_41_10]|uniref:YgjP-like metallopeptidase domain-containing protein n=1 Tax=Candidatus Falkowbacteria bacterium CG23_combo_of_CG06-09_8_20_14_all_41_10 TaxID=1974571 RepID=A0A2G9ZN48_9BACT|nr:MAG: hypothetical protein COX21_02005 [Candidatus Falkowbacteria bacterium CG23_combo_of_CG06-09_8_20_14_all_41_10]